MPGGAQSLAHPVLATPVCVVVHEVFLGLANLRMSRPMVCLHRTPSSIASMHRHLHPRRFSLCHHPHDHLVCSRLHVRLLFLGNLDSYIDHGYSSTTTLIMATRPSPRLHRHRHNRLSFAWVTRWFSRVTTSALYRLRGDVSPSAPAFSFSSLSVCGALVVTTGGY
jgi:hypothetical protein